MEEYPFVEVNNGDGEMNDEVETTAGEPMRISGDRFSRVLRATKYKLSKTQACFQPE